MSFEERISNENGGIETLKSTNLVYGAESGCNLVSASDLSQNLSGIKVQFGDSSPNCGVPGPPILDNFQSASQKTKDSGIEGEGALTESFLISISELRYIVLVCIRWRLQNSVELSSSSCTAVGINGCSSIMLDSSPASGESTTPSKELLVSHLFLYRSCISDSHREELELQAVREILKLIDPSVEAGDHLIERLGTNSKGLIKEFAGGLDSVEAKEMRNAENALSSQFLLGKLPFPSYGILLGKETAQYTIGDIINTTEHPSGLNLANVASTPSILGVLLKYFDVSWPSHIFESLLIQSETVKGESQQQEESGSGVKDPGDVSLSLGSFTHVLGLCKPCVFVNKTNKKCRNGVLCCFCHFQHKERKRGKRYKSSTNSSSIANSCSSTGTGIGGCLVNSSGLSSISGVSNSVNIGSFGNVGTIGNIPGFGVAAGGAGVPSVEGFSKSDLTVVSEDCLRVSTISPGPSFSGGSVRNSHNTFGSAHLEHPQGGVGSAQSTGFTGASMLQSLPDLVSSHCGFHQPQKYTSRVSQGSTVPLATLQSSSRNNSIFGKPSFQTGGEQQQQQSVRYLVPPPPPPPSKTATFQVFQNEKDAGFRVNSVATSTSAGFNQLGGTYLEKGSSERHPTVGIPGLVLDSCSFQGSQGASPSLNDPFFGSFNSYNKLINEASEMNNWISTNSENFSNAMNLSSKDYCCFQWLDQPEIGELITDTWGVGPFEAFTKGNGNTIPQNLNQCLNDSRSYSKAAPQDWSLASSIIKSSTNASSNASGPSFNINNSNPINPNSASPMQISANQSASQRLRESLVESSSQLKTGLHHQDKNQAHTLSGPTEGIQVGHSNEHFLNSPKVFTSSTTTSASSLSDNTNVASNSFITPSGGVIPPFLRGSQGFGLSSEYSDCSPLFFLTGGGGTAGGGTGNTNFGMDFCFLNSWK
ncbi:uncharacterized protein cubi_02423 [Cryptosporidium ubiquitum]|uniref:C3H1-type domain-containing protein n=1 Tax=Cryptosporidium ubiquitum TaxID=857276 RepID=A0A1J4MGR5_9CRYT|nr:uncharacterized protein cubi_02423 [Cryptosporidium ubiquitum]OII73191.1 hypothetical protein cubi_02423 [Cryptosporidium ubiquitum]